jgi:hypothetical protein
MCWTCPLGWQAKNVNRIRSKTYLKVATWKTEEEVEESDIVSSSMPALGITVLDILILLAVS